MTHLTWMFDAHAISAHTGRLTGCRHLLRLRIRVEDVRCLKSTFPRWAGKALDHSHVEFYSGDHVVRMLVAVRSTRQNSHNITRTEACTLTKAALGAMNAINRP